MSRDRLVAHGADVLGLIPGLLGYQPGSDHAVVIGIRHDGMLHATAGITWIAPIGDGHAFADNMAAQLGTGWCSEPDLTTTVVGYGHHAQERAMLLGDALEDRDLPVVALYAIRGGRYQVMDDDGRWTTPQPVPDTGEALCAFAGLNPAASRDAMLTRYDPHPEPTWTLPGWTGLAAQPPSQRADRAHTLIADLAAARGTRDPAKLAELAALTLSSVAVRDAVLQYGAVDADHSQVLVDMYRGAPESCRGDLAVLAATTELLGTGNTPASQHILSHADPQGRNAELGRLIQLAITTNFDPRRLRLPEIALTEALGIADQQWEHDRRHAALRDATNQPATEMSQEQAHQSPSRPGVPSTRGTANPAP